jgi:hypothetical protein
VSFQDSKRQGAIGEAIFFSAHSDILEKSPDLKADFLLSYNGEAIELKSDSYDLNSTPNLFLERWSNIEAGKPGGPWQAQANGSKWFVYFFPVNLIYYRFDVNQLVAHIDQNVAEYKTRNIPNKTYTTQGYLVPRASLAELYKEVKLGVHVIGKEF